MINEEHISSENALQRMGRLQNRPSLFNLEPSLFPHGLGFKEIVEVYGDCGVGKTFLMKELTKKCILPKSYCDIQLNGLEAGVIYLNTDLHFNCRTFGNYLNQCVEDKVGITSHNKEEIVKTITEDSLKRLTVMNIYNSETMFVTFHLLKTLLLSKVDVSLIIIDSISANYWQDRMTNGIKRMDGYVLDILNRLHKCIEPFKVSLIFTRPSYFQSAGATIEVSSIRNLLKVNASIQLSRSMHGKDPVFRANIRTPEECSIKFYSIGPKGITWSPP